MKTDWITRQKLWLYACTLLSSLFCGWVGTRLMNEVTGFLGILLCLFAISLPIVLVVQEIRQYAQTQTPEVGPALGKPAGRAPLRTFLRTWRNMAMASLLLGLFFCADAGGLGWHRWLVFPLTCLGGPVSWLCLQPHDALAVAGQIGLYGLSVAWLFWKPSGWSKAVFILLSVLWVFLGCAIVCLPV